ncbi:MAG: peptidase dimerization domain-containing protein [Streptosporangiales bacterium]|nr:peptidase dimerization domain-containing protein [Streptosporangiales bacterium]
MEKEEILATIGKHFDEERVIEQAVEIARTPCPQTELYDREPSILSAIRNLYRPAYEAAGCATWIDDYGSLIASQGNGDGPHLLFLSYAMAWTEGTMQRPWEGRLMDGSRFGIDGRIIRGRGGSEYHPTNVAQLETARIIHESGVQINGTITYVVSSGGHTSSMDPVLHLIHNDDIRADLCIIPGSKKIVLGNMGRLDLRLNVWGRSVHSGGELSVGENAIEGGLEALNRLMSIMPFTPKGVEDPDMGKGRLSIIGIGSYPFSPGYHEGVGSGGHTLQNLMRIMLDRRLPPGQDVDEAIAEIREVLADFPFKVTYERGALQLPTKHAPDAPVVTTVEEAYHAALRTTPDRGYVDYTIDAGYLNHVGIPTLMFGGIDMRFAHGDDDLMQVNDLSDLSRVFAYWAIKNAQ